MSGSGTLIADNVVRDGFGPMVRSGGASIEIKERNNGINLSSGEHQAIRTKKPATTVTSAPDAVVKDKTTAESSSVVYGVTYECKGDSPAVTVSATGRMVLVGCHFTKAANTQSATGSYVRVEAGGGLAVVGCYFHNAQTAGFAIDNAGAAANVVATGNIRETTAAAPHNNVTVGVEAVV
jgi:hypothetical protein